MNLTKRTRLKVVYPRQNKVNVSRDRKSSKYTNEIIILKYDAMDIKLIGNCMNPDRVTKLSSFFQQQVNVGTCDEI